jgi:response regulator RpfG family c-di-GMP phosphodiesterase
MFIGLRPVKQSVQLAHEMTRIVGFQEPAVAHDSLQMLIEEFHKKRISVPVIFISGDMNRDIAKQALKLGAFNVIEKPFTLKNLRAKVNKAVVDAATTSGDPDAEVQNQEIGYYYNLLKPHYYDCENIIYYLQSQNIPLSVIQDELKKKELSGRCLFDDPRVIKIRAG